MIGARGGSARVRFRSTATRGPNTGSCPGVPAAHCQDVKTYSYYTAGVGGLPSVPSWTAAASRSWLAEAEWRALNSYFNVDRVP